MTELDDVPTGEVPCLAVALSGFTAKKSYFPEPAGIFYEVRRLRDRLALGEDCRDIMGASYLKYLEKSANGFSSSSADNSDVENLDVDNWLDAEDDYYFKFLKNLDPTTWKEQDHYKVLGLSKLRFKATENQIKIAYRKKVLHHHPDKRRHKGLVVKSGEEDYFTCISKAYDTLSNNQRRRAYDSVDPSFDDAIPPANTTKENFFKLYGPAFEKNERFSRKNRCPKFGDEQTPYAEVDKFYKFWYDFDSWREFSYLDEEDKEKGENRDERRWIEKQNRAERDKRRKEEVKRIRTLVDNAYKLDPRVQKYKEDEKNRKEQEKLAKELIRRAKIEEEERIKREAAEEERRKIELEEETRRLQQQAEKREKDALKKSLQKERKSLQEFSQKANFFAPEGEDSEKFANMADLDRLSQTLPLEKLKELNSQLTLATNGTKPVDVFRRFVQDLNEQIETEQRNMFEKLEKGSETEANGQCANWLPEETQLLIKAMTLFPVGTKSRWDVIAAFINEHRKVSENESRKTGKDVVLKVKELQKLDEKTKESVAKGVPLLQVKSNIQVETAPSVRTDGPPGASNETNPWTTDEQKRLEQALRSIPADDPERWEKITACLPGRTKKDCVKRYKEIAELVRARKVALDQQNTNKTKILSGK